MTSASPISSRTDAGSTAALTDASNTVLFDGRWPLTADPRPAFAECAGLARSVVRGPLGDPEAPTPSGMTVQELVPHLVMAMRRAAASGKGIPFFEWPEEAPDVNLSNAVASVDRALNEVAEAWRNDRALDEPRPLPWEQSATGRESLAIYAAELLLHTWDLSQATGAAVTWSEPTLNTTLLVLRKELPMAERRPMWEAIAAQFDADPDDVTPFADAVPMAEDAPLLHQLLGWSGRSPA